MPFACLFIAAGILLIIIRRMKKVGELVFRLDASRKYGIKMAKRAVEDKKDLEILKWSLCQGQNSDSCEGQHCIRSPYDLPIMRGFLYSAGMCKIPSENEGFSI